MPKRSNKKELGKGIRALLKDIDSSEKKKIDAVDSTDRNNPGLKNIPLDFIERNPFQPRGNFDEEAIAELADSISVHGLIQPITVRRLHENAYQIISGERRLRAAGIAGLESIPAYVRTADDQEMLEMALVENIQRENLNPIEIAISYHRLLDECDLTQEELSDRVGKNRSTISNYIRLLKLPPQIQAELKKNSLSMGHARALAGIQDLGKQLHIFKQIMEKSLSVRATEKLIQNLGNKKPSSNQKNVLDPQVKQIQEDLSEYFNTIVKIKRSTQGKGSIVLQFNNDEEFNDILDQLDM